MFPRVAMIAPGIPAICIPTNVATFTIIGPGVNSSMVTGFANSSYVIHCWTKTTSFSTSGIAAYAPPKARAPILMKDKKTCNNCKHY